MRKGSWILLAWVVFVGAQVVGSGTFLSNDLYDVTGYDSAVVFVSPQGVSWTAHSSVDAKEQQWWNISGVPILLNDDADALRSLVVAGPTGFLARTVSRNIDEISFLFSTYSTPQQDTASFSFSLQTTTHESIELDSYGGVFAKGFFWFALYDGGVVKVSDTGVVAFLTPDSSGEILPDLYSIALPVIPTHQILGVDVSDSLLVAFSSHYLWYYHFATEQWDSLDLGDTLTISQVRLSSDLSEVYTLVTSDSRGSEIVAVQRAPFTQRAIVQKQGIHSFSRSQEDTLYLIYGEKGALAVVDAHSSNEVKTSIEYRRNLTNITPSAVTRKSYYTLGDKGSLLMSTNVGGLYSYDEKRSDTTETPFMYIKRSRPIEGGLKEVFAVPSILNSSAEFMTFEYSLSKEAEVTIDIFNANFEPLTRIVHNAVRPAGADQPDGRSTNRNEDRWDGTINNQGGRMAPPGVYFFRITTSRGEKRFGRCVIAKN